MVNQIIELWKEHGRSVPSMTAYLKSLARKVISNGGNLDNWGHAFNKSTMFEDLVVNLQNHENSVCVEHVSSTEAPRSDGIFIEYLWEIDLDESRLGMGTLYTGTVQFYWSFKLLCWE